MTSIIPTASLRTHLSRVFLLALPLSVAACGHSEQEWQAQLASYEKLAQQHQETQDELDATKAKVAALTADLKAMGVELSTEEKEKQKLLAALASYKERAAVLERIKARFESLRNKLEELTKLGLKIEIRKNRMVISLPGDVLFASGKDKLADKGVEILGKVASVIRLDPGLAKRTYQVAGHTDNQPLKATKGEFKDNWGLSLMRARQVLLFLIQPLDDESQPGGGLDKNLWSASGYGDTDAISSNAGKYGRQKNRRVELVMMPNVEEMLDLKSLMDEPVQAPAKKPAAKKAEPADAHSKKS